jgi:hypothetical protein
LVVAAVAVLPVEMIVQDMPEVHQEDLLFVLALKLLAQQDKEMLAVLVVLRQEFMVLVAEVALEVPEVMELAVLVVLVAQE